MVKIILFADDTSLFHSHKDPNQTTSVMNCEIRMTMCWLNANKLSLNIAKTISTFFFAQSKNASLFLGVLVDQHLSWKQHISHITKKLSKTIGIISKSCFFISSKSLLTLYHTQVYPCLSYCNIVWSSTYPSNLNRIFLLQNRIVRIISGALLFFLLIIKFIRTIHGIIETTVHTIAELISSSLRSCTKVQRFGIPYLVILSYPTDSPSLRLRLKNSSLTEK